MEKSKKELTKEAGMLADIHENKKEAIKKILDDLDSHEKISDKHYQGMNVIQELFKEMEELEVKQQNILNKIKGK